MSKEKKAKKSIVPMKAFLDEARTCCHFYIKCGFFFLYFILFSNKEIKKQLKKKGVLFWSQLRPIWYEWRRMTHMNFKGGQPFFFILQKRKKKRNYIYSIMPNLLPYLDCTSLYCCLTKRYLLLLKAFEVKEATIN